MSIHSILRSVFIGLVLLLTACDGKNAAEQSMEKSFDIIIKNGMIYDGSGTQGYQSDIAIINDRIVKIGQLDPSSANKVIDAKGKAVAPGFINMLSWAPKSLIDDGRGLSDIVQGVTLEIFGEGWSMGPLSPSSKTFLASTFDFKSEKEIKWNTLGEFMEYLTYKGVSPNVASFVGATTLRMYELEQNDREPTAKEMEKMRELTREAMEEGALGLGSSLIYAPAFFASTDELIELAKVIGEYDGMYISHMRSEGNAIESAVDELLKIAKEGNVSAEIYHLKFAGKSNWNKFDSIVEKINQARSEGLNITADMYTYTAGGTGLAATMPPWANEGGINALITRLSEPTIRAKIIAEMKIDSDDWENFYLASGAKGIKIMALTQENLKPFNGMSIAQIAQQQGKTAEDTIADIIIDEQADVDAVFFLMSDENIRRKVVLPWLSFASDAAAYAPEGKVIEHPVHPRAYGNFARVLGQYVREEKLLTLAEAVHKLSGLPAENLKLKKRGYIREGYFADIVIFDPKKVADKATFDNPHQLSVGMEAVFVNGIQVLEKGQHTGKLPGRFVKGPGFKKISEN